MAKIRNPAGRLDGGWLGADLAADPSRWRLQLPPAVGDELMELAAKRAGALPGLGDVAPKVSGTTSEFVSRLRDKFTTGCYFCVISGFPLEPFATAQDAYWLLGLLLGDPVSQTPQGTLIGHIEENRPDQRRRRQWEANNTLPFHTDPADLVTMLCVRSAPAGGLSVLASARAVHDLLLAEAPAHLAQLYRPFPQDSGVEKEEGRKRWTAIPVFGFASNGDFSARHARWHVERSQRHPDAPRLTADQFAALDAIDEILARPGIALAIDMRPGDLQLFHNAEILHARTEFEGTPRGEGRLLLRLWLSYADSPELPDDYQELYGATAAGSYRGGAWPPGLRPARIGLPVRTADTEAQQLTAP